MIPDQVPCGNVSSAREFTNYVPAPIFQPKLGRVKRLVGTGAPSDRTGQLLKMSKSLNNAIFLADDADVVQKKVMSMYTDPKRITGKEPGETDPAKNPLWAFQETFNPDTAWVEEHRARYAPDQAGRQRQARDAERRDALGPRACASNAR